MTFPYLGPHDGIMFPDPAMTRGDVVAAGGNLSPGMLLSAYRQGIFPWYTEGGPILWQSPDPRFVLFPDDLHVSRSMHKLLSQGVFDIRFDTAFAEVITNCARIDRPGQNGTWITGDMISAYRELFRLGFAHCAEAWQDGELRGGCYGVLLGKVFFGESMFAKRPNASKAAFLTYARRLFSEGVLFIDCQVWSAHLESLGGRAMSRPDFLDLLKQTLSGT